MSRPAPVRPAAAWLALALYASSALAQFSDEPSITGSSARPPTEYEDRPEAVFTVPDPMPAAPPFDAMHGFETDGTGGRMRFALDPGSLVLGERSAQVTIAALSDTGVLNLGYYGFDCEDLRYQMLAYGGADGQWHRVSRLRWREVRDGDTRNRQYRAVYGAVCQLGGRAASSVKDVLDRLDDPHKRLYVNP